MQRMKDRQPPSRTPTALIARVLSVLRPEPEPLPASARPSRSAGDLLAPKAAWPLAYVTDVSGWTMDQATTQVSLTLTHGARYVHEAASFQVKVPFGDGDLFDKRGAYLVVLLPAKSEEQVRRILRAARREAAE